MPVILLDRVDKYYDNRGKVLDNATLHIEPKEFVIIVGSSGAGKSTLLKLITREERHNSGKIIVGGIDYDKLKNKDVPRLRRRIGVVFQDFKLLPDKTVFENVAFALEITGATNKEIRGIVPRVLEIVKLSDKTNSMPYTLSGGEKQRTAIARALVRQPRILLADEPTGNLDFDHAMDVVRVLEKINDYGTTVLLTTHNKQIVDKLNRRVINITDGRLSDSPLPKRKPSAKKGNR